MKYFILFLMTFSSFAQVKNFQLVYKVNSLKEIENGNTLVENYFMNDLKYYIYANEKVCYLDSVAVNNSPGINAEQSGNSNLYINYSKHIAYFKYNSTNVNTFAEIKFSKKDNDYTNNLLGNLLNKYVSSDGNIIIYTSKTLPWYAQPCIFVTNMLNEGIVKVINKNLKYELELISLEEIKSETMRVDEDKILNKDFKSIVKIKSPFLQ